MVVGTADVEGGFEEISWGDVANGVDNVVNGMVVFG